MSSRVFKCFRCSRCCVAGLFIPLSYRDFYDWFIHRCYLPILFTIKESNSYTEEASIEWAYTLLTSRHSIFPEVYEIVRRYNIDLSRNGCALFNARYGTCRIYRLRPLVCKIFPFNVNLRVCEWALHNCEAIKKGLNIPPRSYRDIALIYAKSIEETYSNINILNRIERIRINTFEKILTKIIVDRYELENLKYLLFNTIEYG